MTKAVFRQHGNEFEVTVSGHAGFNPGGPDIVCASCSMLTYTLLQAILSFDAEGAIIDFVSSTNWDGFKIDKQDGAFIIRAVVIDWALERMETVMQTIADGFALLAQRYPQHVSCTV